MIERQGFSLKVFFVACLIGTVVLVAACGSFGLWSDVACRDDWYGLRIIPPPGAEVLQERCRSAFNPDYRLVFMMSPDDLQVFQAATPIETWSDDASGFLALDTEAARADRLLAGRFADGVQIVEALVDMGNPDRYTVYYNATYVD